MERIKTPSLLLTKADLSDLTWLREIDRECDEYFRFDPQCDLNHNCSLEECLTTGDIPPGVMREDYKRDHYCFFGIWQEAMPMGFLSFYLEYSRKDTAYLSVLYVKEAYRNRGIGAEVLDALTRRLAAAGYQTIRLHCSLRNATALRFWVRNGFDHILDIHCDGNLFPGNFAGVELMKTLSLNGGKYLHGKEE